jgi:hypothetical protein
LKLTSPAQLHEMKSKTMETAIQELKLDGAAQAELDLWLHASRPSSTARVTGANQDATSILANEVRRQADHVQFPWLAAEEAARRSIEAMQKEFLADKDKAFDALRSLFVAKARISSLGQVENLVGQYLLYAPDRDYAAYLLMSLLLKTPAVNRVSMHNWMIASDMPRSDVEAYGAAIQALTSPLYPATAPLSSQNQQLLEKALSPASPSGGGVTWDVGTPVVGSGVLPVMQYPEGPGVDMAQVEQVVNHLQQQISAHQQQLSALKKQKSQAQRQASATPRGQPPAQPHLLPAPQPQRRNQQQQQQPYQQVPQYQQQQQPPTYSRRNPRGAGEPDTFWDSLFPGATAPPTPPPPPPPAPNLLGKPNPPARF